MFDFEPYIKDASNGDALATEVPETEGEDWGFLKDRIELGGSGGKVDAVKNDSITKFVDSRYMGGRCDSQEISGSQPVEPENQPSVKDQALADYQTRLKRLEQLKERGIKAQRGLKAGGGRRKSRKTSGFVLVGPEKPSISSAANSPPGAPKLKQSDLHDGKSTTAYDRKL